MIFCYNIDIRKQTKNMKNLEKNHSLPKPDGYYDTGWHAYAERDLSDYRAMVFNDSSERWLSVKPDDITPDNPMKWSMRHEHRLRHYVPLKGAVLEDDSIEYEWDWPEENIFGGDDGFFVNNSQVLDLGCGHGKVAQEINEKYGKKKIKCTGLDHRLGYEKPPETDSLVAGNFKSMPFRDGEFDRLLGVESFPAWLPTSKELMAQYFLEITRVSKEGAIWRGTLIDEEDITSEGITTKDIINGFVKNGWELLINGRSFAARLVNKKKP